MTSTIDPSLLDPLMDASSAQSIPLTSPNTATDFVNNQVIDILSKLEKDFIDLDSSKDMLTILNTTINEPELTLRLNRLIDELDRFVSSPLTAPQFINQYLHTPKHISNNNSI